MKNSTRHSVSTTIRLLLMVTLAVVLTLGSGLVAQAAVITAPVNLGAAAPFVILTKSGITNVPTSAITGDLGVSPIAATAITGFPLTLAASGVYSTTPQVNGKVYAANYASPTPSNLTTAVLNMQTAYTNAAGRPISGFAFLNRGAGHLGSLTLSPGVYKWGTAVSIAPYLKLTLNGGPTDVWIFQVAGTLTLGSGAKVRLTGGALAKNVFWQVAGTSAIGTTAHMEGTILDKTNITFNTGASLNGRALAQTAVTLIKNTIVIKK
jgi:hypothetical protein